MIFSAELSLLRTSRLTVGHKKEAGCGTITSEEEEHLDQIPAWSLPDVLDFVVQSKEMVPKDASKTGTYNTHRQKQSVDDSTMNWVVFTCKVHR